MASPVPDDTDIRYLWLLRQLEEMEQLLEHLLHRIRELDLRVPKQTLERSTWEDQRNEPL